MLTLHIIVGWKYADNSSKVAFEQNPLHNLGRTTEGGSHCEDVTGCKRELHFSPLRSSLVRALELRYVAGYVKATLQKHP